MAVFSNNAVTDKGRILLAESQVGALFVPTKIVMGSGTMPSGSTPRSMTAVATPVVQLSINKKRASDDGKVIIGGMYSNTSITEAFYFRELGLYAQLQLADGSFSEEVLYAYANAGSSADLMAAASSAVIEKQIDLVTYIGSDTQIDLTIESGAYIPFTDKGAPSGVATLGDDGKVPAAQLPAMDFDPAGSAAAVQTALSGHTGDNVRHLTAAERTAWNAKADGTATSAHIANTNNPHGVTAAQVGALPLSGGTLTGNLDIAKTIASVVLRTGDSSNRLSGRLMKNANVEGTVDDGLYLTDYGADGSEATLKIQGGQQRLRIKLGGTDYAVYHEGSKPTPADIGAIPFDDSRADIPEGADLNSYTAVGAYRCKNNATAESLTNSPTTDAFIMDILPSTGTSRALDGNYAYLIQKIMTNGNRYYARKVSTNGNVSTPVYGAWIEFYTTLNKPTPADVGITSGTTDLTAGSSSLASGTIYLVYE